MAHDMQIHDIKSFHTLERTLMFLLNVFNQIVEYIIPNSKNTDNKEITELANLIYEEQNNKKNSKKKHCICLFVSRAQGSKLVQKHAKAKQPHLGKAGGKYSVQVFHI